MNNNNPPEVERLFRLLDKAIAQPKSDLQYHNPFELLIAVILSAQATDKAVNKVTPELFAKAPEAMTMAGLGTEGIKPFIKSLGLFNNKSKNIAKCCQILSDKHQGKVPSNRTDLEALPGVGRKTAGVVLNVAFGKAEIPVDTHIFRVGNRTGLTKADNPLQSEMQLKKILPDWVAVKAHHLLILHGRYVCKARKPLCADCVIQSFCQYFKTGNKKNLQ